MHISQGNAMKIVNEMSDIIHQNVNMMNAEGIIIASTDPTRIGQFHAGAKKILIQKLDEICVDYDDEYEGAKKGVNLPIIFQNELVGVIGITGEKNEVAKYGQIIKKMTEILLLNIYIQEQQAFDEKIRTRYLEQWIFGENTDINQAFIDHGNALGIDITLPRRVMIFSTGDIACNDDLAKGQRLIDQIERNIRVTISNGRENLYIRSNLKLICLVRTRSDEHMRQLAQLVRKRVYEGQGVTLAVGIDSPVDGTKFIHRAFSRAEKALRTSLLSPGKEIRFYNDVSVEIFINEISRSTKREYINRIFRGSDSNKLSSWIDLLETFFGTNSSITAAAEKLYMHKNTLQYRLKKLHDETGFDPRVMPDAALFYLAILFYRDEYTSAV